MINFRHLIKIQCKPFAMSLKPQLKRVDQSITELDAWSKKFASAKKQIAKADYGVTAPACDPATCDDINYLNQRIDWLREDYNYLREMFSEHMDGHLPPLTASAIAEAIKILGLSKEYVVQPKVIYASDGSPQSVSMLISK